MVTWAGYAAALLSLLPIAVVLYARSSRSREAWAVALDVPLAFGADLMLVLALSRVMTLETATLVSRAIWLIFAAFVATQRRAQRGYPRALGVRATAMAIVCVAAATSLSLALSRPYSIWDRKWHTPLTASLRGQLIPFQNIFNPAEVLHYHFAGDVHAAMIQSLSLGTLHSSLALSISHDIAFGLIGLTMALLLSGLGLGSAIAAGVCVVGVLLNGPLTLYRGATDKAVEGYSVLNYMTMSFRPHDAIAGLFYVGFVGAIAARTRHPSARFSDTALPLLLSTAGLAISDETTIGLLGLSLGATWLLFPTCLHPKRWGGALLLLGLAVALIGPNLAFAASLAPGAQKHAITIVPFRSPGCYTPTLPLTDPEGRRLLLFDLAPTLAVTLGAALAWLADRNDRRKRGAILMLTTLLVVLATLMLTRIDVDGQALESHRFMTGAMFIAPLGAVLLLIPRQSAAPKARGEKAMWLVAAAAALFGMGLSGASTGDWIAVLAPAKGHRHTHFFTKEDLYAIDCRDDFGVRLGAMATPHYLSKSIWYAYAGCQPTFAPGVRANAWELTIGNPYFDQGAIKKLDGLVEKGASVPAICEADPAKRDAVCNVIAERPDCEPLGTRLLRCQLTPADRKRFGR